MNQTLSGKRTQEFLSQTFTDKGIVWFINMRWMAVAGVIVAVIFSQYILELLPPEISLYLWSGAGMLFLSNLCFWTIRNRIRNIRSFILLQMSSDLFILTYLLYFSGGVKNPLLVLYVFHIMIAGILLPRGDAYIISLVTSILMLGLSMSEYLQIIPHYALKMCPSYVAQPMGGAHPGHNIQCVLGFCSPFILLLFGTAYFTTTIMEQLRLSHQKLIDNERLAVMGQITAYIAHEVNNPIAVISSKVKLALASKGEQIPAKIKDTLEIIDKYSDRIAGVVRGLLNLLRPHQTSHMSAININKVISESLIFIDARLHQSKIELEKSLDWNIPFIYGRFHEMGQVVINLINNAIDAMPGGGKIRIETGLTEDNKIKIVVSDTGMGIPREHLSSIFVPFFSTKAEGKGIGLGLSMSRAVVKAHGGDIQVESSPGKGTKFIITLPQAGTKETGLG